MLGKEKKKNREEVLVVIDLHQFSSLSLLAFFLPFLLDAL
jgi:hypothetical protein